MAYDEDFAHRVRELLADQDAITEKAMFGGLAFLLHGNMAVGISRV
jgi:TfoX/Sxy family transcriptional regulator of competence genes